MKLNLKLCDFCMTLQSDKLSSLPKCKKIMHLCMNSSERRVLHNIWRLNDRGRTSSVKYWNVHWNCSGGWGSCPKCWWRSCHHLSNARYQVRYLGEGQRQTRISDIVSDFGGYSFFLSVLLCRRMGSQSLLVDVDQYVTERQGLRLERSSDLGGAL